MKRLILRLSVLFAVVVLGLIAMAYARSGQEVAASDADAPADTGPGDLSDDTPRLLTTEPKAQPLPVEVDSKPPKRDDYRATVGEPIEPAPNPLRSEPGPSGPVQQAAGQVPELLSDVEPVQGAIPTDAGSVTNERGLRETIEQAEPSLADGQRPIGGRYQSASDEPELVDLPVEVPTEAGPLVPRAAEPVPGPDGFGAVEPRDIEDAPREISALPRRDTPQGLSAPDREDVAPPREAYPPLHRAGDPSRTLADDLPLTRIDDAIGGAVPVAQAAEGIGRPGARQLEGEQAPSLALVKVAPQEIQVGKECTFSVQVRNTGGVAAHQVTVYDEIPQGTRLVGTTPRAELGPEGEVIWKLGALNAGEETSVEMQLMPTSEGEVGSVARVNFDVVASVRTLATKPELALRLTGPREVMVGGEAKIKIEISNPGSGPATGVMLLENVPPELSHPLGHALEFEVGTLQPGESREMVLILNAEKAGDITNVLIARGDASIEVQNDVRFRIVAPDLHVALSGPSKRYLERQATYQVTVNNPGTASAKDVQLVTHLPKGLKFVRANNHGQYDETSHSVVWGLDELPAQESGTVELVAVPIESGEQTLRVEGRAGQGLTDQARQTVTVEGLAAILFEVVDVDDPIEVSGETTYEIRVVNQGSKAATNIQVLAHIPPGMKPLAASGPTTHHPFEGNRVQFESLPRLAPKADTTYRIKVQGLSPGDQRLRVELLTGEFDSPVTKEESTRVYADE